VTHGKLIQYLETGKKAMEGRLYTRECPMAHPGDGVYSKVGKRGAAALTIGGQPGKRKRCPRLKGCEARGEYKAAKRHSGLLHGLVKGGKTADRSKRKAVIEECKLGPWRKAINTATPKEKTGLVEDLCWVPLLEPWEGSAWSA